MTLVLSKALLDRDVAHFQQAFALFDTNAVGGSVRANMMFEQQCVVMASGVAGGPAALAAALAVLPNPASARLSGDLDEEAGGGLHAVYRGADLDDEDAPPRHPPGLSKQPAMGEAHQSLWVH